MNLKFSNLFVSVFFTLSVFAEKNAESLVSFLPEDTLFVLEIDNLDNLQDDLGNGPFGKIMEFPIWVKLNEKIENELQKSKNKKIKSDFKVIKESVIEPLMDSIEGGIVCGISDFANLFESETIKNEEVASSRRVQKMPFFALIFESSLIEDDFEEMLSRIEDLGEDSNMRVRNEKINDISLTWFVHPDSENLTKFDLHSSGFCISLHKGKFFLLSGDKKRIDSVFETFTESKKSSNVNDAYEECFEEIGRGQARLFVNFKEGIRSLPAMSSRIKFPQNPFGIDTVGLIDGLGLDGLNHFGLCLNAKSKKIEIGSSLGMDRREGILSFLAPVKGNLENHTFVSKDVLTVSNAKNDLGQIWPRMEKMLKDISPALHLLVTSQIQAFEDQADVAIRSDLLGSLGDELVSLTYLHQDNEELKALASPSSSIYAIRLRDPKLFDRTMRAMIDSVSQGNDLLEENEYRGVTIRSIRGLEEAGLSISYAITDDWLLLSIGKMRYLNQVLNRMKKGQDSLWDCAFMENAMYDLPRAIRQVDYVDMSKMFSLFEVMFSALDEDEFSFSADDFGDFPYFLLGWSKDTDNGFVSKAKLYPISE